MVPVFLHSQLHEGHARKYGYNWQPVPPDFVPGSEYPHILVHLWFRCGSRGCGSHREGRMYVCYSDTYPWHDVRFILFLAGPTMDISSVGLYCHCGTSACLVGLMICRSSLGYIFAIMSYLIIVRYDCEAIDVFVGGLRLQVRIGYRFRIIGEVEVYFFLRLLYLLDHFLRLYNFGFIKLVVVELLSFSIFCLSCFFQFIRFGSVLSQYSYSFSLTYRHSQAFPQQYSHTLLQPTSPTPRTPPEHTTSTYPLWPCPLADPSPRTRPTVSSPPAPQKYIPQPAGTDLCYKFLDLS